METEGRDAEKAHLQAFSYYRGQFAPHFAIIDAYHDWAERKLSAAEALARVHAIIDENPTAAVLDTAAHWFRRAVAVEPSFEGFITWLADHKSADVRVWAPGRMLEPRTPAEHALFARLLEDRSAKVRRAAANAAESWRWYSVVDRLRVRAESLSEAKEREEILSACDFIVRGFRREGDYVRFYSGKAPGGAGGTTSSPKRYVDSVPFERISREEELYRRQHGAWPTRPENYDIRVELLAAWRPLA